jgi:hypothetical protein
MPIPIIYPGNPKFEILNELEVQDKFEILNFGHCDLIKGFPPQADQVSAPPPAKKTAGQIEKETNSSPRSSQRTLRKKFKIISAYSAVSAVRYFLDW